MRLLRHAMAPGSRSGMLVDGLLCFAAVLLASQTLSARYATLQHAVPELPLVLAGGAIFAVVMGLTYALMGLYRPAPIALAAMVGRMVVALAIGGYITSIALRVVGDRGFIEQLIPGAIAYLGVGLVVTRLGLSAMRRTASLSRVLVVGDSAEAREIGRSLVEGGYAARNVVGLYPTSDPSAGAPMEIPGVRLFPRNASIPTLVLQHDIDEIIVAVREQRGGGVPMDQLLECRIKGIPVLDLAGFWEKTRHEVPIDSLKGSWLIYGHGFVQGTMRKALKRVFDIASAIVLLVALLPVMLITMIAIKLDSRGPILYRQPRVGLGGETFVCLKFRSMRIDAEKDGVARWALRNDPRITRVGNFIRKTRIDELPQLLSVLKGEMSLVGPRPERPGFVSQLKKDIPFYDIRHSVKPGVTGWAQVRYHYGATLDDARRKHQFDLYYVKNNSLLLDILVLIETVSVVMFREGQ